MRVAVRLTPARDEVEFAVADTGIGIPEKDLSRIFDEFVQIENPLQRRVKGTGLGLPLSKRLAELLGGRIGLVSEHGVGSTFSLTIPLVYRDPLQVDAEPIVVDPQRVPVLVVEDTDEDLLLASRALSGTRYQLLHARYASRGRRDPRVGAGGGGGARHPAAGERVVGSARAAQTRRRPRQAAR